MNDRHLTETEIEDYANEQAESEFARETMEHVDDEMTTALDDIWEDEQEDLSIGDHFNLHDYDADFYDCVDNY